jgi:hypothetical protein
MAEDYVFGEWTIFECDRAAQQKKEPYWTLVKEGGTGLCLARGPFGRKSMEP